MMTTSIDRHGQTYAFALEKLGRVPKKHHTPILRMVRGIFVLCWNIRRTSDGKLIPRYVALAPQGRVIRGIPARKETITAAGGRRD